MSESQKIENGSHSGGTVGRTLQSLLSALVGAVIAQLTEDILVGINVAVGMAVAFIILVMPGQPLAPNRLGRERWVRWLSVGLVFPYIMGSWWVVEILGTNFWAMFVPILIFTTAVSVVNWRTMRTGLGVFELGFGITLFLLGLAGVLGGASFILEDNRSFGTAFVLLGAAITFVAIAVLVLGRTLALRGQAFYGLGGTLAGVAGVLMGIDLIRADNALFGYTYFLLAFSITLIGMAVFRKNARMFGVGELTMGVAGLLFGSAVIREGEWLSGAIFLSLGVAFLLAGTAVFSKSQNLLGCASCLFGLGIFGLGVIAFGMQENFYGIVFLLAGVAALLGAVRYLIRVNLRADEDEGVSALRRVAKYLREVDAEN